MINDKDKAIAQRIVNGANISIEGMSPQAFADLCKAIEAALTTVRKEAREAAFKEAIEAVKRERPTNGEFEHNRNIEPWKSVFDFYYKTITAIQAAANNEEGAGDG